MNTRQPQGLDTPPLYDFLTKDQIKMSDIWVAWFSSFYEFINLFLSQTGIFIPQISTVVRNSIQQPKDGQLIFNTDLNSLQFYQLSTDSWRTVSFT